MSIVNEPEATPLELLDYLMAVFGKDWIYWEPETLWKHIDLSKVEQPAYNKNKIHAMRVILNNDTFWKDWVVFEKVTLALNGLPPDFNIVEEVSPAHMAFAIRIAYQLRRYPGLNTPGKDPIFSSEVKKYIAARCFLDGTVYLPEPLSFAQAALNDMTGMNKLALEIESASNNPDYEIEEDPISVGAVKTKLIRHYAYSDRRKAII